MLGCVRQMPYEMAEPPSSLLKKRQEICRQLVVIGLYIEDKSVRKSLELKNYARRHKALVPANKFQRYSIFDRPNGHPPTGLP